MGKSVRSGQSKTTAQKEEGRRLLEEAPKDAHEAIATERQAQHAHGPFRKAQAS